MSDAEPTPGPPTEAQVVAYVAPSSSADAAEVGSAYAAEKAAQARRCRVPADDAVWPADLAEALLRRVAHNLALRQLPLGVQASISEVGVQTNRVGGTDAEVRRLEAPFRKVVLG